MQIDKPLQGIAPTEFLLSACLLACLLTCLLTCFPACLLDGLPACPRLPPWALDSLKCFRNSFSYSEHNVLDGRMDTRHLDSLGSYRSQKIK